MLEHGGRLQQAAQRYEIPRERWLDLSTGINPMGWQATACVSSASWNRLPEDEDGLLEAAEAYYGAAKILPVSGSQAAIQALPRLRSRSRVGVPALGYNEHAHRWKQAGHDVVPVALADFEAALAGLDVLVVSNPNNPTGDRFVPEQLLDWHARLHARRGWLVIDEAFVDSTPQSSVARFTDREGLIVLRSLGKFFGLAGARVGFVLSSQALLQTLAEWLGPWALAGPSRVVAKAALQDQSWQKSTRQRLRRDGSRLADLLASHGLKPTGGCDLFQWISLPNALSVHESLARQGILTRYFAAAPSIRFGLPAKAEDWQRLETALSISRGVLEIAESSRDQAKHGAVK
jgi:cobalamin biosynthesis protein CobC